MNNIELNHIDLNSIGLDSKQISGISKSYKHKIKPYIKGHVTDGSSSFTFKVNNTEVTVPVGADGNFKWAINTTLTSLQDAFKNVTNVDRVEIQLPKTTTISTCFTMFGNCSNLNYVVIKGDLSPVTNATNMFNGTKLISLKLDNSFSPTNMANFAFGNAQNVDLTFEKSIFKNATSLNRATMNTGMRLLDFSLADNCADFSYIGQNNGNLTTLKLPNIKANATFLCGTSPNLENVEIKSTKSSLDFRNCGKLTEQSVVNIFNAVAADDIVLTFHQNVWNMIMREIDIQGSPIQVAYQNMIDNYDVTIANASFDAEIEYIEGDGTQWLDTGTKFKVGTSFYVKFEELEIPETPTAQNRTHIFGVADTNTKRCRLRRLEPDALYILYGVDGAYWSTGIQMKNKGTIEFTYTKDLCTYSRSDGATDTHNTTTSEQLATNSNITAFYNPNINDTYFIGRFYAIKIWENDTLVRDMIPVRKGTTGYMYDKVSGNLFGNSGTGDFILGNDK